MHSDLRDALRLAGIYVALGALWIICSDSVLHILVTDRSLNTQLQTLKALLFILISASLLFSTRYKIINAYRTLRQDLKRQEQRVHQLQRNSATATWEYRDDFHWNPAALQILGRDSSDQQTSLAHLLSWLHPSERNVVQRAVQALLDEQTELNVSARLQHTNPQQSQWIQLRGEVDAAGNIFGTIQDITQQKRDEASLRESELRFRQLFEQTPRIAVQGYDRENRVIFWNEASTHLYGYSVNEVMGRRMEELIVPPQQRRKVNSATSLWQRNGSAVSAGEIQQQRQDGALVWVYSSQLVLRNRLDQLEMYRIDIDLTDQKKMHHELQISESRYRSLVENLGDAIFLTNDNELINFTNPAWESITGYPPQESLGFPLHRFIPELGQMPLRQRLNDLNAGLEHNLRLECQLLTRSGQVRRVELMLSRSEPEGTLHGSLHDVQERYQAQHLQQARNAVLDKLLGHQPLESILNDISKSLEALQPQMRVSIMLLDCQNTLYIGAAPSLPSDYCRAINGIQAAAGLGSCGHAASTGELTIADDIAQHPYWASVRDLALNAGLKACWSLPFKDESGKVLGTFGIYYPQPTHPSDADIALVTEFTRLAGLAVQSSRRPR